MPKLYHLEKVNQFVSIGVRLQEDYKSDDLASKGVWNARLRFPKQQYAKFKTLQYAYDNGNKRNKILAIEEAEKWSMEEYGKAQTTDITKNTSLRIMTAQWLQEAQKLTEANETLKAQGHDPIHEIKGGRGYWNSKSYKLYEQLARDYLYPFYKTLKAGRDEADILLVQPQDLDKLTDFIRANPSTTLLRAKRPPSPGTILKAITALRHTYRFAYDQKLITTIPQIARPKAQLKARARRELSEEEFQMMKEYTRKKYQDDSYLGSITYANSDGESIEEKISTYRDYMYLFHLWIMVIAGCGIRPPTSGTEHTMVKWSHYSHDPKTKITTLTRPNEKGHTYKAVILPAAVPYWEALERFQKERGIYKEDGYVFAHPIGQKRKKGGWEAGDPIKNFRGQWNKMMKDLGKEYPRSGFNAEPGTIQAKRITPYALRSFFITNRLSDGDANIEKLAFATGTNYDVIMEHYFKFATEKEYDKLIKGGYERTQQSSPKYNQDGYYIGHDE